MRYIRTKNRIYELKENDATQTPEEVQIALMTCNYKSADTIEELCDRYVGISNNKPMIIKYEFDEYYDEYNDSYTKEELLVYDAIYGAIWTNKGLIYVAKMDNEGKLVLI